MSGKALLAVYGEKVAASVGSACHAHGDAVSGILAAMGCDTARAMGAVRLSVSWDTTPTDIDHATKALIQAYQALAEANWIDRLLDGDHDAAIIDAGTGDSTLGDDLLTAGFFDLTLVDLAPSALAVVKERLGERGAKVAFMTGDITRLAFPKNSISKPTLPAANSCPMHMTLELNGCQIFPRMIAA